MTAFHFLAGLSSSSKLVAEQKFGGAAVRAAVLTQLQSPRVDANATCSPFPLLPTGAPSSEFTGGQGGGNCVHPPPPGLWSCTHYLQVPLNTLFPASIRSTRTLCLPFFPSANYF